MFKLSPKLEKFKSKRKWSIQQLFCATDFESLMYPCFTFCRILGIFPYKISASTIKTCKPCYILSFIILCVFCVCQLINLYNINVSEEILFKHMPRKLQLNCFYIFGNLIIVFAFILNKSRMRLIQTILELSFRLSPKSYQNLSRLIHTKDICAFLSLIVQSIVFFNTKYIFSCITGTYIALILFQMDMLYMNCVCVIKACFKQINDNLANLRELVVNGEPYILRSTYHKQRNLFLLMELKALKKQHLAIIETVHMLNMIFSLHLFITTVISFLEITFTLYFYIMYREIGILLIGVSKQTYDMFLITLIMNHLVKMALIIWACETGKNEAKQINTTVHNMLNSTSDEEVKYELQLFSLQLMYRENMFSAKMFNMDATLLTTLVGRIATYLLILIQFLFTSHSCDK